MEPSYTKILKMAFLGCASDEIKESIVRMVVKSREAPEDPKSAQASQPPQAPKSPQTGSGSGYPYFS